MLLYITVYTVVFLFIYYLYLIFILIFLMQNLIFKANRVKWILKSTYLWTVFLYFLWKERIFFTCIFILNKHLLPSSFFYYSIAKSFALSVRISPAKERRWKIRTYGTPSDFQPFVRAATECTFPTLPLAECGLPRLWRCNELSRNRNSFITPFLLFSMQKTNRGGVLRHYNVVMIPSCLLSSQ